MEIGSYLGINVKSTIISDIQQEYKKVNDQFGKRCMEAIIQKAGLSFYVEVNCEVKGMRDLPQLFSNSIETSEVVLTGEIKSSTMLMTERKASIGAANLLRLLRSSNNSIKSITKFCLPNMQSDKCITKIDVTWENYLFNLNSRYQSIPLGIQSITQVLHQQNEKLPTTVSRT